MTSFRPFSSRDLLKYNLVNTDALTETYGLSFYLSYLAHWPEYFVASETVDGELSGYIMGKSEGEGCLFHGHVTAVTVAPPFRRQKIANKLMKKLERVTEDFHDAYFVDLFVRASNENAIRMYEKMGYGPYRRVIGYYGNADGEDALDMRKAMRRDTKKRSVIKAKKFEQKPWEIEWH